MHLLAVSGFLGSGKTTFIIKLAEFASNKGIKTAVIVNEIGEIGIDDQLMKQLEMDVWQIMGGCICCSLRKNLVDTIKKLIGHYTPQLLIVEPSGAAYLDKVYKTLNIALIHELASLRKIVLTDPLRLEKLATVISPLLKSQIGQADLILVNKIDQADEQALSKTETIISGFNPDSPVIRISAKQTIPQTVISELLPWMS